MDLMSHKYPIFRAILKDWYQTHQRDFPWLHTNDPYVIWLSEIILQQTRTAQGLPYFNRIIEKYPTVQHLASVEDDVFMKDWQGLGYYSRARNLLFSARWIVHENKGKFPENYAGLLQLKGVGPYTAAAIASFAYGQKHAVVDGNVIRVIARYFGISEPVDTSTGRKEIDRIAHCILDKQQPGSFNQAMLDFGATVCTPKKAQCPTCPLLETCVAYESDLISVLPVKSKKIKRKKRYFYFIQIKDDSGRWAVEKRTASDIWQGLFQWPMVELDMPSSHPHQIAIAFSRKYNIALNQIEHIAEDKQHLTHQTIYSRFYQQLSPVLLSDISGPFKWVTPDEIHTLAWPKIIATHLNKCII